MCHIDQFQLEDSPLGDGIKDTGGKTLLPSDFFDVSYNSNESMRRRKHND